MAQIDPYAQARRAMVQHQIELRGVRDASVLDAMRTVPRHLFVDVANRDHAYGDFPLPIGFGQTISQPYMVACMVELCGLGPGKRALEVGAGSGYEAAILAQLCDRVVAIEIIPELARGATAALEQSRISNVNVVHGDGSAGWPDGAPYDAIVVAAGAPSVPPPMIGQLANGGRLVIPVGASRGLQRLQVHERRGDHVVCSESTACRFVDLRGKYGWQDGLLRS